VLFSAKEGALKKTDEYRKHAKECRELAQTMTDESQRQQLLRMAEAWESLARDREEGLLGSDTK
jgi:hypothetical protein